jgi:hypothetical protein
MRRALLAGCAWCALSCARAPEPAPAPAPAPAEAKQNYPWLDDTSLSFPAPVDSLDARFAPPPGFSRVDLADKSFGLFLRHLPLAAPGTPVVTFTGALLHPATDPRISAVVSIDVGTHDTQQCADSIIRMHAEWKWSLGKRDESYHAASGVEMPFARWLAGERIVASGMSIAWKKMAPASEPTHPLFRKYLETVFGYASTRSLAKEGTSIDVADLAPGDFVIAPGNPGHTVLVLDLATSSDGRRVALLGQGYMPAQSFQVLRSSTGSPWFVVDASSALDTPFWDPFPWSTLRRLD